ncbi:prolyl oligopeptidase family serine peptidase [Pelagibacteraceae bacterium]|nr:prolyl oligopeptidase family serine peptidase [Pelagibacteraceae bacterium]
MNIPKLRKEKTTKTYHGHQLIDEYAYVDQPDNILEVLQNPKKLLPEVRKYLEENNKLTEEYFKDAKDLQKKLFLEIKSKIKLTDESLKFKDNRYFYWTKTVEKGNYGKYLRQKIGSPNIETYFDVDNEKELSKSKYFGLGSVSVSHNDQLMAYSVDLKGSEYYDIFLRNLSTNKLVEKKIENTSGSVVWNLDSKSFFYTPLDKYHRSKKIYKHNLGDSSQEDELIFEEKDDSFSVNISLTADEEFFVITTSDSNTVEEYFFSSKDKQIKPKLFKAREKSIRYSIDSFKNHWYVHTNKDAQDYQVLRCNHKNIEKLETFIPPKDETIIGGFDFLDNYILRSEKSDAIPKLFIRNIQTNEEEELIISKEAVGSPGFGLMQKNTNTTKIRVSWDSMATPGKIYEYDIVTKEKKLVKEVEIPSGHNPDNYLVERIKATASDGRKIPITLIRRKDVKLDGKSKLLLYAYGCYKHSVPVSFSSSRFCLIDRGIIFGIAHVRGGGELGEKWYVEGKLLKKKQTFTDYVSVCNHLIKNKYTYKGGIAFYGGSAGGTTGGAVINMNPELFFAALLLVPYVDCLTTALNDKLPLTPGEYEVFGNPKKYKEYFDYIKSYAPYNNLHKTNYPPMLVTSSIFDNRVLYSEPTKYIAKLRDLKKDNNLQLLKCKLEAAGHGGASGRDNAIIELAEEFSFILKNAGIKD